jgi:hypothetical protein
MNGFLLAVYISISGDCEVTELRGRDGGGAYFTNMSADLENIYELN